MRGKKYNWFIGTDISRNKLDHSVMKGKELIFHKETGNDPGSIREFILELKAIQGFTIAKSVFCMEETGIYGNHWINGLLKFKANIVREQSIVIMKSHGPIRGKSDKIDSFRIAEYAYFHKDKLRLIAVRRPIVEQLHQLNTLRSRMLNYKLALKTPLKEGTGFLPKKQAQQNKQLCNRTLAAIGEDATEIDRQISTLIQSDPRISRLFKIIVSVASVGPITAAHIIAATNEFRSIKCPKKFACYCGVAPFPRESGNVHSKRRVSALANKKMKSLMHLCAVQAMRFCPELKPYFIRKTELEGKHKMAVINAIRYKLILRIFACVNQDRLFEPIYVNPRAALPAHVEFKNQQTDELELTEL